MKLKPREIVAHPVAIFSMVTTAAIHTFHLGALDAAAGVVWMNVSMLFTASSIFAFTVLPNVDLGPLSFLAEWLRVGALILGAAYAAKILEQFIDKVRAQL